MSTQADQLGDRIVVTGRAYILSKVAWLGRGAARARLVASLMAGGIGRADKGRRWQAVWYNCDESTAKGVHSG